MTKSRSSSLSSDEKKSESPLEKLPFSPLIMYHIKHYCESGYRPTYHCSREEFKKFKDKIKVAIDSKGATQEEKENAESSGGDDETIKQLTLELSKDGGRATRLSFKDNKAPDISSDQKKIHPSLKKPVLLGDVLARLHGEEKVREIQEGKNTALYEPNVKRLNTSLTDNDLLIILFVCFFSRKNRFSQSGQLLHPLTTYWNQIIAGFFVSFLYSDDLFISVEKKGDEIYLTYTEDKGVKVKDANKFGEQTFEGKVGGQYSFIIKINSDGSYQYRVKEMELLGNRELKEALIELAAKRDFTQNFHTEKEFWESITIHISFLVNERVRDAFYKQYDKLSPEIQQNLYKKIEEVASQTWFQEKMSFIERQKLLFNLRIRRDKNYLIKERVKNSFGTIFNVDNSKTSFWEDVWTAIKAFHKIPEFGLALFEDRAKYYINYTYWMLTEKNSESIARKVLLTVVSFVAAVCLVAELPARELLKRVTSPVRAFKEAKKVGGWPLAILSAAVSVALVGAAAVFAAPLVAAGLTAIGGSAIVSGIGSALSYLSGTFLGAWGTTIVAGTAASLATWGVAGAVSYLWGKICGRGSSGAPSTATTVPSSSLLKEDEKKGQEGDKNRTYRPRSSSVSQILKEIPEILEEKKEEREVMVESPASPQEEKKKEGTDIVVSPTNLSIDSRGRPQSLRRGSALLSPQEQTDQDQDPKKVDKDKKPPSSDDSSRRSRSGSFSLSRNSEDK